MRQKIQGGLWIFAHRRRALAHHVDESRRDNETCRIDDPLGLGGIDLTDSDDLATANTDIGDVPWGAAAIDDSPMLDQDFQFGLGPMYAGGGWGQYDCVYHAQPCKALRILQVMVGH